MLYILSGQDDFSLARSLAEIKKDVGDREIVAVNTTTLDGQQVTPDQLKIVCDTAPFLAEKRLVVIEGLLERFESRRRPGRQKKTTPASHPEQHQLFTSCITLIPDSTVLVLVESRVTGNNPLFKELSAKAVVKSFPLLKDAQLRQWVQKRVMETGDSISSRAVDLLAKLVGSNLWIVASEIDKLVLFTSGRRIEEDDVRALVSYTQQASVFAVVDAIIEFKADLAEQSLQRLLQSGATPSYLMVMLSRQVQMIVRAKQLSAQRRPKKEIQQRLGLVSEFALGKTLEQASRYSLPRLKEIYQQLLETDLSIKTGRYSAELALNILVADLCRQGKPHLAQVNRERG